MSPWNASLMLVSFSFALYFGLTLVSACYYYDYLRGKMKRLGLLLYFFMLSLYLVLLLIIASPSLIIVFSIMLKYTLFIVLLYIPLLSLMLRFRRFKCEREEKVKTDDVEYIVCYSDIINAWFNRRTGKFYISNRFRNVLTNLEIKAVMLHEKGHAKNRFLGLTTIMITTSWYIVITTLALFLMILFKFGTDVVTTLGLIGFFIPIAPSITVITMMWSWIYEHESDLNALRNVGYESIASALIKVHVYGVLEPYLEYIKGVELNQEFINKNITVKFLDVLMVLFKYSWDVPLWYSELIKRPMYRTHPPLRFRLAKLRMQVHT